MVAERKQTYVSLPFNGDALAELARRRIIRTNKTFFAARLPVLSKSGPVLFLRLKGKVHDSTA